MVIFAGQDYELSGGAPTTRQKILDAGAVLVGINLQADTMHMLWELPSGTFYYGTDDGCDSDAPVQPMRYKEDWPTCFESFVCGLKI